MLELNNVVDSYVYTVSSLIRLQKDMCWINWFIHLATGKSFILALDIVQGLKKRDLPFGVDSTTIGSPPLPVPTHTPVVENLQLKLPISRSLPRHNSQQIHILFNNKSSSRFLHKLHKHCDILHPQWRHFAVISVSFYRIICTCSLFTIHPVTELSNFKSCDNLSLLLIMIIWKFGKLLTRSWRDENTTPCSHIKSLNFEKLLQSHDLYDANTGNCYHRVRLAPYRIQPVKIANSDRLEPYYCRWD